MPLGFGSKKDKADELEKQKSSLFGRSKSKPSSPAPSSANPYAVPQASNSNPYGTKGACNNPYAPQSQSSLTQPSTSSFSTLTLNSEAGAPPPSYRGSSPNPREKSPVPPGGYGGGALRYPVQSAAHNAGYGSDPYGGGNSSRPGGYGGLGRSNSQDTVNTDMGRKALFGDAAQRAVQHPPPQEPSQDTSYGNSGGYSDMIPGGYGEGPPRELTAQELEDQDVDAIKQEIKQIKREDLASTRNALRIAEETDRAAREILERLGQQGERIHNTERNLDMSSYQNRLAHDKAKELKKLNQHFMKPTGPVFNKAKREAEEDARVQEQYQQDSARREATRAAAYSSQARHQQQQRDINGRLVQAPQKQRNLADRSKYQFEADSDEDQVDEEIEDNGEALGHRVGNIKLAALAIGDELDRQNKLIDRVTEKSGVVGSEIARNSAKLDRIAKKG